MDNELQPFNPESGISLFEKSSKSNDITYWLAAELMQLLGYDDKQIFRSAISKAQIACANLNIPVEENFILVRHDDGGVDTKLTRFACYLVAMNADVRKPQVASAQAYFANLAESLRKFYEEAENVVRIQLRGDITDREKSLMGVAKDAGVIQYALFHDAGYMGMYNMHLSKLRAMKGVPENRSPLDFMGKAELAANIFRITQTEEKIKAEKIKGQKDCENAAHIVGKEVRNTMRKLSGQIPEELPPSDDIRVVKKEIKQTHKKFREIDSKSAKKKKSK